MKTKIVKALKTRFPQYGLSDSVLERIAAQLEPNVKEEKDIETAISGVEPVLSVLQSGDDAHRQERLSLENRIKELEQQLNPQQPQQKPNQEGGLTKEDIASLIAEAIKPLSSQLEQRNAEDKASKRRSEIIAKAAEYKIPEDVAVMMSIPEDADLDTFMKEKKQVLADHGFSFVQPPQSAEEIVKTENESIAKMINDGTKAIVEPQKN